MTGTESNCSLVKRNPFIDSLKGVAIILVVLGHVISLYSNEATNPVFRFCYSFHMALFFVISGYLSGGRKDFGTGWLKKRACKLLIPWVLWTFVYFISSHRSIREFLYALVVEPWIWFLPCLWLCECCLSLLWKADRHRVLAFAILYTGICVFGVILGIRMFSNVLIFLVFYLAGYAYRVKGDLVRERVKKTVALTATLLYPLSMTVYTHGLDEAAAFAQTLVQKLGLSSGVGIVKMVIWANSRFIIAMLGVIACSTITKLLLKLTGGGTRHPIRFLLIYLGKNTMPIYLLSGFCTVERFDGLTNTILSLALGLICPCIAAMILRRCPKIYAVILGG